ncbi:MAG: hypothetical protein AVDCRST_MAG59-2437 [uncultured Thermomicrobiales bacterium]|uniref:Major facilitator superfamily (MFS) profile domain-containing protein n=1 Tax=uncultured Thermomicrobiales bacterium TaxID=1645740 RepID=A0A6J4URC1_9BACT|nr:MAG: hypothetical protein AVDCRST_MAG59-2437 [uncultured Thermomicrobiales bacterium]
MSEPAERSYRALRHRDFRLLWGAELLSGVGTQGLRVGVAWQIFALTGDPLQLGLLGLARFVPLLLLGLVGGVVADRGDRRRTLLLAQIALLATSATLAGLAAAGRVTPLVIYGATGLAAAFGTVAGPTRQALVPGLVPSANLPGALAMTTLAHQVGGVVGPALGGLLIATRGPAAVYLLDAVSFGVVAVALASMRTRPFVAPTTQRGWAAVREGLAFLRGTPILLGVMGLDFLATFFGAATVLMPVFAEQVLGGGPTTLGLLLAAPAAGAVTGGVAVAAVRLPDRPGLGVLVAVAAYGAFVLGFGLSTALPVSLALLAASGAADAVSMAFRHTLRTLVTPDRLRGRVAAAHSTFAMGGPQLGEFEAGLAAAAFGAPVAVATGGIGVVLTAAAVAWKVPGIAAYRIVAGSPPDPSAESDAVPEAPLAVGDPTPSAARHR